MPMLRSIKGMNDVLPAQVGLWRHVEDCARGVAERFGYSEIRTPLLEHSELFSRGVGEATDIVEKEMYAFADRGGEHLALRPEGTAGVVRAYIEHSLHQADPETRLYYLGPMYRRERPQKGRFRQFHQFGVEVFGVAAPEIDAEVMAMLHLFLTEVGIGDVVLEVNCLGDADDRPRYLEALTRFLGSHREALCGDCQRRLDRAPLRVLDCKVEGCRSILADAPLVVDHLGEASRTHFDGVQRSLDRLGVPHRVNPRVVRGLDYYTRTVFEAVASGLGSQNAICGGGRYDRLVEQLGGPAMPAVGYAQGIERLVMLLEGRTQVPAHGFKVALIPTGEAERARCEILALQLRRAGITCILDLTGRSVKAQLRRSNRVQADLAVVLGETELREGEVELKMLRGAGAAERVKLEQLVKVVQQRAAMTDRGGVEDSASPGDAHRGHEEPTG
ncbi:MAG: histidine--tRNA ligase [Pseudomonadota bacterium]